MAMIILLFIGLGYISLADFIFHRIALFVLLLILAGTVRTAMHWGAQSWVAKQYRPAASATTQEGPHGEHGFWLGLTLDMIWFALCIPAGLLVVGFEWLDISRWFDLLGAEIETFDQSSIIVPNSQLITESLENWFYKNRRGRVRIQVGVSYSADADQVRTILLDCAAQQA